MPQKNYNDFKEKYPYDHMGTLVSMYITDTSIKNSFFFLLEGSVLEYEKDT